MEKGKRTSSGGYQAPQLLRYLRCFESLRFRDNNQMLLRFRSNFDLMKMKIREIGTIGKFEMVMEIVKLRSVTSDHFRSEIRSRYIYSLQSQLLIMFDV